MSVEDDYSLVVHHPEQSCQCGDISITYDSFGDKNHPPILMVMGLSTQLVHWPEGFCRMLAKQGFWVVRFDNRDMGKSTTLDHIKPTSMGRLLVHKWFKTRVSVAYELEDMAQDAVLLLDQLNITKAHVVGASMGGMIAQLMAIHHPDRLLSLTNIMSTTGDKRLMNPSFKILWTMLQSPGKTLNDRLRQGLKLWRRLHGKHFPFPHELLAETLSEAYHRGFSAAGVLRQLAAISVATDRTEQLKKLRLPSLIIHGDADDMLKVKNAYALHDAMPHSQKLILEGMGHTLPRECWSEMVGSITAIAS